MPRESEGSRRIPFQPLRTVLSGIFCLSRALDSACSPCLCFGFDVLFPGVLGDLYMFLEGPIPAQLKFVSIIK